MKGYANLLRACFKFKNDNDLDCRGMAKEMEFIASYYRKRFLCEPTIKEKKHKDREVV
jgi:hypothetical protein